MEKIFSTRNVHPHDRFEYWHEVACKRIIDHRSEPNNRSSFKAKMDAGSIADIDLLLFENSPMLVFHTKHQARSDPGEILLCRQMDGALDVEQGGYDSVLNPGDVMLLDPRLPYTARFSGNARLLVLKIERRLLQARLGDTQSFTARSITPTRKDQRFVSAFLGLLPSYAATLSDAAAPMVRDQALDLLTLSLSAEMSAEGERGSTSSPSYSRHGRDSLGGCRVKH